MLFNSKGQIVILPRKTTDIELAPLREVLLVSRSYVGNMFQLGTRATLKEQK
jgi:hypothetical protein